MKPLLSIFKYHSHGKKKQPKPKKTSSFFEDPGFSGCKTAVCEYFYHLCELVPCFGCRNWEEAGCKQLSSLPLKKLHNWACLPF